jgi:hypothetical protein
MSAPERIIFPLFGMSPFLSFQGFRRMYPSLVVLRRSISIAIQEKMGDRLSAKTYAVQAIVIAPQA